MIIKTRLDEIIKVGVTEIRDSCDWLVESCEVFVDEYVYNIDLLKVSTLIPCHCYIFLNFIHAVLLKSSDRLEDAIEILEYVVGMREEKLGTANPDVDDEKKRLAELLKEAGRVRSRQARSLENLLDANPHATKRDGTMLKY